MKPRIYLDNNATTFLDLRVASLLSCHIKEKIGNPSSVHSFGREARTLLQNGRRVIADYLSVRPNEIVFTSGGTEGLNMVIRGLLENLPKGRIITSSVEHSCVYSVLQQMQAFGWEVVFLSPGDVGAVSPEAVAEVVDDRTRLIVLMAANNETGVKTDIAAVAAIADAAKIPFVVDGVALLGKETFTVPEGVAAMCFSGHKIHAPAGIGFSFIRSSLKLAPMLVGGPQEFERRGGTENLLGILAVSEAVRLLQEELPAASMRMRLLRAKLEEGILQTVPHCVVNGTGPRISNTANIAFQGLDGETLLAALDREGVAVSHGSACSSGALEPSRILLNMGLSRQIARCSLRFSLSRQTTEEEIDSALTRILFVCSKLYR